MMICRLIHVISHCCLLAAKHRLPISALGSLCGPAKVLFIVILVVLIDVMYCFFESCLGTRTICPS